MTLPITSLVQLPQLDELVELYDLDATNIPGGEVYHFTPMTDGNNSNVVWGGVVYVPVPIQATGFETSSEGTLPTPHIKVANVNLAFSALCVQFKDLLGATLTRHRTFKRYLDGQPDADPTSELGRDVYRINQKVYQNKIFVEWELAAVIDQEGRMLPGRTVLQVACNFRYRRWTGTEFDYTHVTCPYIGDTYFDINGNVVGTPQLDVPSKRVDTCCQRRFQNVPLPTGAFPGVSRA
jgi:lambda family phage minor tail protein L